MSNRVALITGSSRGIGRAIAWPWPEGCQIAVGYYESSQVEDEVNAAHRRDTEEVVGNVWQQGGEGGRCLLFAVAQQLVEQTVSPGPDRYSGQQCRINKDNWCCASVMRNGIRF